MPILTADEQYTNLGNRLLEEGEWVYNKRTGKKCLTVIGETFKYDCRNFDLPLITTRKAFWKSAIAEMLGYLVGFDDAAEFKRIGTPTWFANANENKSWLANRYRKGENDMGRVYGVQGRQWRVAPTEEDYALLKKYFEDKDTEKFHELHSRLENNNIDQLQKVANNLMNGVDDRGETITFWNFTEFDQGCLRPCMHTHTFSILGGKLYLTSAQRSIDVPLGLVFNMPQCAFLLYLMADMTGLKPGIVYHNMINLHIYEDQIEPFRDIQLKRKPFGTPKFKIKKSFKNLQGLEEAVKSTDFKVDDYYEVTGYECHDPIKYPFSE
jgi:thymidylate synthase